MKKEVNKEYSNNPEVAFDVQEPCLFQVIVYNDDFTPMAFVMEVLGKFFYMDRPSAANIMLEAHIQGKAVFGRYTKDVAETKVSQVSEYAKMSDHPFTCDIEELAL